MVRTRCSRSPAAGVRDFILRMLICVKFRACAEQNLDPALFFLWAHSSVMRVAFQSRTPWSNDFVFDRINPQIIPQLSSYPQNIGQLLLFGFQ